MQYAVAFGNAFDGHTFYGPFDSYEDALEYGATNESGDGWFTISLEIPND